MTTNISYIDTEFIKELDKQYISPKAEYWKPVENGAQTFYKQYIETNMTFFILLFLIIFLLLYRYRSVKNDKENYPDKYTKKYQQEFINRQLYENSLQEQNVNPIQPRQQQYQAPQYPQKEILNQPTTQLGLRPMDTTTIYKTNGGSVNYPNAILDPYNQGYLTQPFFQPFKL